MNKFLSFLKEKIISINDSPHKIALGFGLGVFTGILPGTGPLAALFLAFVFRVNRAAALIGSAITNTWLSFVIFAVSLKLGAFLTGTDFSTIRLQAQELLGNFHWDKIFSAAVWPILKPLMLGYLISGMILGVLGYLVSLSIILLQRNSKQGPS